MKLFFAWVLWITFLLMGGTSEAQSGEIIPNQCRSSDSQAPDQLNYTSSFFDLLNSAVSEENQGSGERPIPSFLRITSSPRLTEKYAESTRNHEISDYIYLALFHMKRLEGPGIIHPFDYFW